MDSEAIQENRERIFMSIFLVCFLVYLENAMVRIFA